MALCPVRLFNWAIAAGNNTPSLVSCWHHHLCTAGNSGTAAIWPQRKRADACLVSGATERHPARWPSWGRRLQMTDGPFFSEQLSHRCTKTGMNCPRYFQRGSLSIRDPVSQSHSAFVFYVKCNSRPRALSVILACRLAWRLRPWCLTVCDVA